MVGMDARRGQSVIELTLALIASLVLFFGGITWIWGWLTGSLIWRQRAYDCTRAVAADATGTNPWPRMQLECAGLVSEDPAPPGVVDAATAATYRVGTQRYYDADKHRLRVFR